MDKDSFFQIIKFLHVLDFSSCLQVWKKWKNYLSPSIWNMLISRDFLILTCPIFTPDLLYKHLHSCTLRSTTIHTPHWELVPNVEERQNAWICSTSLDKVLQLDLEYRRMNSPHDASLLEVNVEDFSDCLSFGIEIIPNPKSWTACVKGKFRLTYFTQKQFISESAVDFILYPPDMAEFRSECKEFLKSTGYLKAPQNQTQLQVQDVTLIIQFQYELFEWDSL